MLYNSVSTVTRLRSGRQEFYSLHEAPRLNKSPIQWIRGVLSQG